MIRPGKTGPYHLYYNSCKTGGCTYPFRQPAVNHSYDEAMQHLRAKEYLVMIIRC